MGKPHCNRSNWTFFNYAGPELITPSSASSLTKQKKNAPCLIERRMLIRWFTPHDFATLALHFDFKPIPLRWVGCISLTILSFGDTLKIQMKQNGLSDNYGVFAGRSPKSENKLRSILQPLCLQNLPIVNRSTRTVRNHVRWQSQNESSPKLEAYIQL